MPNLFYTLSADASLVVELQASAAATQNTSKVLLSQGLHGKESITLISAKEFNLKAGETKAQIVITRKTIIRGYADPAGINAVGGI